MCSYDRAGYGWSEPAPWPPTAARQAENLFNALTVAGERGPYVLVGHSYGAYVVRAFARTHADSVVGVVLVDPAHPSQHDPKRCDPGCLPAALLEDLARLHRLVPLLARFGVLRVLRSGPLDLFSVVNGLPPHLQPAIVAALSTTRHWTTGASEFRHYDESAADARALRSLGGKPLAVVVASSTWAEQKDGYRLPAGVDGRALDDMLLMLSRDQATLSTDSDLRVVEGATHVSLVTHRHHAAQVSDAIRHVVETVRSQPAAPR